MACPICTSPDGAQLNEGMRAGAGVLILAAVVIIGALARFAARLWKLRDA